MVWATAGDKAADIFVGTKGTGDTWYGNEQGPCLECENRGWWATGFEAQFVFYNPNDLAKVAAGAMQTYEPQPYATLNVDQYLYHIASTQQKHHLGAACFDRSGRYLYVLEVFADGDEKDTPLVHVWEISNTTNPTIIYVNKGDGTCDGETPCYTSIQDAINAASTGSAIRIAQGTYSESITLSTSISLTLIGGWNTSFSSQTPNTTFIKAPKANQGSLTLQELTIQP